MVEQRAQAHVVVDENVSDEQQEGLQRHLAGRGISATLDASYALGARESVSIGLTRHERGAADAYKRGDPAWTVLIHAPVNELVNRIGPEALREAFDELRALRGDQTSTSPASGLLFLVDGETGVRFDLDFQLPVNAYTDLESIRVNSFAADPVSFHRQSGPRGRWRAPR